MRIRRNNPNSDHLRVAPPDDALPANIVTLLEEYRRSSREHELAHNQWSTLQAHRRNDDQDARREDAAAAAQAARDGLEIDATPAMMVLVAPTQEGRTIGGCSHGRARRGTARRRERGLCVARDGRGRGPVRRCLRTPAGQGRDVFLAAVRTAAAERGVEEWLYAKPYDDSGVLQPDRLHQRRHLAGATRPRRRPGGRLPHGFPTITTLAND